MGVQIREFGRLNAVRRRLLGISLFTLLSFALLQSSRNGAYYFVYLEPWLILSLMTGAEMLMRGETEISLAEQVLLTAAHVAVFAAILKGFWILALCSFCAAVLARANVPVRLRAFALAAAGIAAISAVLFSERFCWELGAGASYLLNYRPALLALLLGLPWLLMIPDRPSDAGRRENAGRFRWVFLACCLVSSGVLVAAQLRHVAEVPSEAPYELPRELEARLLGLRHQRRLVAPAQLWFYAPYLAFQAADARYLPETSGPRSSMARVLADYSPDLVLWPVDGEAELRRQVAELRGRPCRFEWGSVWHTPSGDWRELRIACANASKTRSY